MSNIKYSNWKILKQFQDIIKFLFRKTVSTCTNRLATEFQLAIKHGWSVPSIYHLYETNWNGFGWTSSWILLGHPDLPRKWSKWFQKPFFVIDTGNVFTWLTVIHYNSCFLGRLFSMQDHYTIRLNMTYLKSCFTASIVSSRVLIPLKKWPLP